MIGYFRSLTYTFGIDRQKENEKTVEESKKRKAPASKKPAAKKAKGKTDDDEDLARQLSGRRQSVRDRDATKAKSKKAEALAALKKEKKILQQKEESSDESSLDFGDDDDDDSDDDYEEGGTLKPWQKKARASKSQLSRLDKDDDSDMDIDDDDDEAPTKESRLTSSTSRAPEQDAGLEDFVKVTIPRRRLARWCNEPFFTDAVLDCFVRLFIGEDDSGEKVYRLCEIVGVETGKKSYRFPVTQKHEKPISTNKMLRLKFGRSEKAFPMLLISDAPPAEIDVHKYITAQKNNRDEVLSKRRANKLRRKQDELVNTYTYTKEDIERNLQARKKEGKSLANLGLEQTKIAIAVQAAREAVFDAERRLNDSKKSLLESSSDHHDTKEIEKLEEALEKAKALLEEREEEERVLQATVDERKRRLTKRKKDQNWAKVNERALQANQRADREANKSKEASSVSASGSKKETFNPYARRRVKPKILWEVGQDGDKKDEANGEEKKESGGKESAAAVENGSHDTTPTLVHEVGNDNTKAAVLSESHQFAIDEEGLAAQSSSSMGVLGLVAGIGKNKGGAARSAKKKRVRQGLSLSDYLELKSKGTL